MALEAFSRVLPILLLVGLGVAHPPTRLDGPRDHR